MENLLSTPVRTLEVLPLTQNIFKIFYKFSSRPFLADDFCYFLTETVPRSGNPINHSVKEVRS